MLSDSSLYTAFQAKDSRFDGRFFVGVSSTGIYCRPVCRARLPKAENCTFFATAAEAESAGYRPCLLCRPELAPGSSTTDASSVLAKKATQFLEENCGSGQSLEELAGRLGCTGRHLRRVFMAEYHVTPVQYMQTCRLLLAKNLLTDTSLSVTDAAMVSGFGSLRRFNDLFKKHYRLSPTALKKELKKGTPDTAVTISLGYRPPYLWEDMLRFLSARSIQGVDLVKDQCYWRTVRITDPKKGVIRGWLKVSHQLEKHALRVSISDSLLPVLPQVLGRVRHMFDLYCDPDVILLALASPDPAPLKNAAFLRLPADVNGKIHPIPFHPGVRLPGCFDPFEMAVRAVLGQQITVKAANTLAGRIAAAYGEPLDTDIDGLTHTFPTPEVFSGLDGAIENHLGPLGVTSARAKTIRALSEAFLQNTISFGVCADPETETGKLLAVPGIGSWTAKYIAMRTMAWTDAFLETDAGIRKAVDGPTPKELLRISESWRPWRSYAVVTLWNSLEKENQKCFTEQITNHP